MSIIYIYKRFPEGILRTNPSIAAAEELKLVALFNCYIFFCSQKRLVENQPKRIKLVEKASTLIKNLLL